MIGRLGLCRLGLNDGPDMRAGQALDRLGAVKRSEFVNDVSALRLRARAQIGKIRRSIIGDRQGVERPWRGAPRSYFSLLCGDAIECRSVLAHKIFAPRRAGDVD